jgi:F420H(2)-dependent quinone reductase
MPAVTRNKPVELFWKLHKHLYRATGGRLGRSVTGMPILVLHTRGRRSGKPRTNALAYFEDGDNLVVVASNAGEPRHPAWWLNLREGGETNIEVGGDLRQIRAREATEDERARLWARLIAINPDYETYQRRTERRIPVVVLEPRRL